MKRIITTLTSVVLLAIIGYLLWPAPEFPAPPPESLRSAEPADTESIYRRAYFTNLSRDEVMNYYYQEFGNWGIKQILPPEDAYTVIREQTRSSYLEEVIHPSRESLYINGYVPTKPADQIYRNGQHYLNKITVRYVPSNIVTRLTVLLASVVVGYLLFREYRVHA